MRHNSRCRALFTVKATPLSRVPVLERARDATAGPVTVPRYLVVPAAGPQPTTVGREAGHMARSSPYVGLASPVADA
eukprot:3681541-Pyramimonas_sp.AAC.1